MKLRLFTLLIAFAFSHSYAQTVIPFSTIDYVDVNSIKAAVLVHGDMWWNPTTQLAQCEFPQGSGKNISFAGALWMSGYDAGNNLHVAAQMFRQTGNDYWPGPLDASDTITYANSQNWAKIWKVSQNDINVFKATSNHTTANIPDAILTWPAKGNPYAMGGFNTTLTINNDMALFVDVNNDGIYNPLQGDYPAIKGDQALWWVFNDNGPTHNQTNGTPLKVEVHCMAYAYSRGTLIDNVIYYDYSIINRSASDYANFRIGQFADMDLGYGYDDYIGFDSTHRMGYIYNSSDSDYVYGRMIPTAGVTMITLPGDNGTNVVPAGSFMYFNNDFTSMGDPFAVTDYNNYLRAMWRDSTHVKLNCSGHDTSAATPNSNYVYTGNPGDTSGISECKCGNPISDRRFVIASNDFTLAAGATQHVVMALVTTNENTDHYCGNFNLTDITTVADTAWAIYANPLPTAVNNVIANNSIQIYPNPAHDNIYIKTNGTNGGLETISVYNMLGQAMSVPVNKQQNLRTLNIYMLPPGVYSLLYRNGDEQKTTTFVKE